MATETIRPNATGGLNQHSPNGTGNPVTAVSDNSPDTYLRNNTGFTREDRFELAAPSAITSSDSVDSVDVRFRTRTETSTGSATVTVGLRLDGVASLATAQGSIPTSETDYSRIAIERPGGGSWSTADLAALQVVVQSNDGTAAAVRIFELHVDVQYTVGGAVGPPEVNVGRDVAEWPADTEFTRTAAVNDGGSAVTSLEWQITAGPGVGTTIGTAAKLAWIPTENGPYELTCTAANIAGPGSDSLQITVVGTPIQVAAAAGEVAVEGLAPTVTMVPVVRDYPDAGDVLVEGLVPAFTRHVAVDETGPAHVAVDGLPIRVAHHLPPIEPTEVVVDSFPIDIQGRIHTAEVEVEGLPIQVSYGSRGVGGRGGLVAVPPAPTTRYIVQSILTGEFLTWDLPLADVTITYELSGPTSITGSLRPEDPEVRALLAAGMEPWACWLHVETDGLIRASGILQPYQINDETYGVEVAGPSAYPQGLPFLGELSAIATDPADIVRAIWAHVQSYPDGRLGVKVLGSTPVRIGEEEPEEDVEYPEGERPAGPYKLSWWEGTDCGGEIDSLASSTPFDYVEHCEWLPDRSGVRHWIELHYPRAGARKDNLRFATGENIIGNPIPAEETDDLYASQVVVFGKGEGRDTIRGYAGRRLGSRLRRVAVVQDATIATNHRADARAGADLERRQGLIDITDIEVDARHDNARFGTYAVGDDIPIDVEIPWLGRLRQFERVISITYSPDQESVRLQLRRAEAFRYGGQST